MITKARLKEDDEEEMKASHWILEETLQTRVLMYSLTYDRNMDLCLCECMSSTFTAYMYQESDVYRLYPVGCFPVLFTITG